MANAAKPLPTRSFSERSFALSGRRGAAAVFAVLAVAESAWLAFLGWMAWRG